MKLPPSRHQNKDQEIHYQMSKTVIGLFKNKIEAQNIKHELVNEGYSADDIRVMANEEQTVAVGSGGSSGRSSTESGLGATISNFFRSLTGGGKDEQGYAEGVREGGAILSVTVPDGEESKAVDLLEHYGARGVNDQQDGTTSADVGSAPSMSSDTSGSAVPVVQEELAVGKRQVQRGGVRVYSHLVETPVQESVQLREEHVRVDRQNVNRPATEADFSAFEEGTIEFTETAEEAVVSKNARVVEEVVVGKESSERTETIQDTVRHTEVEIEQLGPNRSSASSTH
jgi:uncharacterized protein (TIGR02271 family)